MLSSPVTNCESPDGVAINPSRLCPRWPIVMGRVDVAEQTGRYRFNSSARASFGASSDRHPPPGDHARTASASSGFTGLELGPKVQGERDRARGRGSGSASAAAPRTMLHAISAVAPSLRGETSTVTPCHYATATCVNAKEWGSAIVSVLEVRDDARQQTVRRGLFHCRIRSCWAHARAWASQADVRPGQRGPGASDRLLRARGRRQSRCGPPYGCRAQRRPLRALQTSGGRGQPQTGGGAVALRDANGDGRFEVKERFGIGSTTGIALRNGYVYLAHPTTIERIQVTPAS